MSSVNIDNDLFQQTKAAAAVQGKTVDEFVAETLQQAVHSLLPRRVVRNGLPTIVVNGTVAAIDPEKVRQSIEENGF